MGPATLVLESPLRAPEEEEMKCDKCGQAMKELFTSHYCDNCDCPEEQINRDVAEEATIQYIGGVPLMPDPKDP